MEREKQMAQDCANYVNKFGFDNEEFATQMSQQHRTLQQSFVRAAMAYMKKLAECDYYDDRNEASVMLAKRMKEDGIFDKCYLPFI